MQRAESIMLYALADVVQPWRIRRCDSTCSGLARAPAPYSQSGRIDFRSRWMAARVADSGTGSDLLFATPTRCEL